MSLLQIDLQLKVITCPHCGGTFGLANGFYEDKRVNNSGGWHCPYCAQERGFYGKTQAQRLQEKLNQEREASNRIIAAERARHDQTREELRHTEAQRRGEKAAKTKLKKRIQGGACPCCNRTFTNLERHMATKHPDFAEAKA